MLRTKPDNKQYFTKSLMSILSNLKNFHSLEVVDRVCETQLQVGGNSNSIILRLKDQTLTLIDWTLTMLRMWFQCVTLLSESWRPIFLNLAMGLTVLKRLTIITFGV